MKRSNRRRRTGSPRRSTRRAVRRTRTNAKSRMAKRRLRLIGDRM